MNFWMFNPVDRIRTSAYISTVVSLLSKLFIFDFALSRRLQTWFVDFQVVDFKVKTCFIHSNRFCLSTTAIDL
jgi:hypothetical protein